LTLEEEPKASGVAAAGASAALLVPVLVLEAEH
jgi:hypothetical protein